MKNFILVILFAFCVGCKSDVAAPEVPPISVTGAEKPVPIGEIVTLNVSHGALPSNIVDTHYEWKVIDNSFSPQRMWVSEDGTSVSFGTGSKAGKLVAILDATYTYADLTRLFKGTKSPGIALVNVQVGDPVPVPPPAPPKPPDPTIPDGQFKLAKIVYDGLLANGSTNKDFLLNLSTDYKAVAQQVRAGVLNQVSDILASIKKSNQEAFDKFKEDKTKWTSLELLITNSLYTLYTNKQLTTTIEYATAYTEIANGIDIYISTLK